MPDRVLQLNEGANRAELLPASPFSFNLSGRSGVSAHAVNAFGFNLNLCSAINQAWKFLVK